MVKGKAAFFALGAMQALGLFLSLPANASVPAHWYVREQAGINSPVERLPEGQPQQIWWFNNPGWGFWLSDGVSCKTVDGDGTLENPVGGGEGTMTFQYMVFPDCPLSARVGPIQDLYETQVGVEGYTHVYPHSHVPVTLVANGVELTGLLDVYWSAGNYGYEPGTAPKIHWEDSEKFNLQYFSPGNEIGELEPGDINLNGYWEYTGDGVDEHDVYTIK